MRKIASYASFLRALRAHSPTPSVCHGKIIGFTATHPRVPYASAEANRKEIAF